MRMHHERQERRQGRRHLCHERAASNALPQASPRSPYAAWRPAPPWRRRTAKARQERECSRPAKNGNPARRLASSHDCQGRQAATVRAALDDADSPCPPDGQKHHERISAAVSERHALDQLPAIASNRATRRSGCRWRKISAPRTACSLTILGLVCSVSMSWRPGGSFETSSQSLSGSTTGYPPDASTMRLMMALRVVTSLDVARSIEHHGVVVD